MAESGQLISAAAGAFPPHMMSREMPRHNGVMYHMGPETEAFSPHYRGSVCTGSTFPGHCPAVTCSLEQAVSRVVVTSSHPAELNCSTAPTIQNGCVGQKQLPDEVARVVEALPYQTNAGRGVNTLSPSVTSHGPDLTTQHLSTEAMLSAAIADRCNAVTQHVAQTATVSVTCAKPVSSSAVQHHQQCAADIANGNALSCSEVNSSNGQHSSVSDHLSDRADNTLAVYAVKLEPKTEMETSSDEMSDTACPLPVTDVKVEIKTEQLKHEIKSEVAGEESVDSKDQQTQNAMIESTDAVVVSRPVCDTDLKKESSGKGMCLFLSVFARNMYRKICVCGHSCCLHAAET